MFMLNICIDFYMCASFGHSVFKLTSVYYVNTTCASELMKDHKTIGFNQVFCFNNPQK